MSAGMRLVASRNTLRVAIVVAGVSALRIAIDTARYGFWPLGALALVHALGAALLAVWTWRRGARWSVSASDLAYILVVLPHLVTFWLTQQYDVAAQQVVDPLMPNHSMLLAIALVPPSSLRLGVALIGLVTAHSLALGAVIASLGCAELLGREPWMTLVVATIAGSVLWSRRRRRELELRLALLEARADALARLNRVLFALRDRANTPLQTLEVAIGLLEQHPVGDHPVLAPARSAMRRAIAQLIEAQRPLANAAIPDLADQLAVDLERELRELRDLRGACELGDLPP